MELRRVDFALIPDEPMFGGVIEASQDITDEYYDNENVIDEKTFPPHVSLHICAVPADRVAAISDQLRDWSDRLPELVPAGIERASGGYIMLNLERTADLLALHEAVLELAADAREGMSDRYGSQYIRDLYDPHLSLAKVDYRDVAGAERIARASKLRDLVPASTRSLDLCDIGERSERWEVLTSIARRSVS
jgi:hypothetical protein